MAAYNTDETELNLEEEAAVIGNKILSNIDFDKNASVVIEAKENVIKVVEEEGNESNKVLLMEKTNSSDPFFQVSISSAANYPMLVFSYDIKPIDSSAGLSLCTFRDNNAKFNTSLTVSSGKLMANGRMVTTINDGTWYNIAAVFNFVDLTYNVYVDNKLVAENINFQNPNIGEVSLCRTTLPNGNSVGKYLVDNYCVYEGKEPRVFTEEDFKVDTTQSVMPSEDSEAKLMAGKVGLHLRSGVLCNDGVKSLLDPAPYVVDGRTLIPVRAVSEAFGLNVEWNEATETVTIDNDTKIVIGSKTMTAKGKPVELDVPAEIKDGRTFIPFRALCEEVLGKKVYYDDTVAYNSGMIVISDNEFKAPSDGSKLQALNDYLFYYRPKTDEIQTVYSKVNPNNEHPRIMARSEDFARLRDEVEKYPLKKQWADGVIKSADALIDKEVVYYHFEQGERLLAVSRETLSRTKTLGMAYQLTGNKKYADRAYEELYEVCHDFPDWHPDHYLDTGEMMAAVAIGYDWCYDAFTEEQKKNIEEGAYKFGLEESEKWQYGQKGYATRWCLGNNNWNVVCNGGVAMGALAFMEVYPETCRRLLQNNIRGVEAMMFHFAPDGAWFEGPGYWGYAMQYVSMMFASLDSAMGTDFGLSSCEGLDTTADFILQMQSTIGTFNFADSGMGTSYPETLFWLSNKYGNPAVTAATLNRRNSQSPGVLGLLWYNAEIGPDEIKLPLDQLFRDAEAVAMRESWTAPQATYAAFHGGQEVREHSHLDAGAFVFDSMGERWAIDIGTDDYNLPGYWDTKGARWKIFRMRAESHNTVIINPDGTGIDHNLSAVPTVLKLESKPRGAISFLDMSEPLKDNAKSAKRGYYLTDNRKSLVVRDEIDLKANGDVYWFMYTKAPKAEINGQSVQLTSAVGNKLNVDFAINKPAEITFEDANPMEGMPNTAGAYANKGIYRIKVKVSASGRVNITAKLSPDNIEASDVSKYDMDMEQWIIPDGEIPEAPLLDALYIDGEMPLGFDPQKLNYKVTFYEGDDSIPQITAESSRYNIEIMETDNKQTPTVIKVSHKDDPSIYTNYTINYVELPKAASLDGYTLYNVKAVTASSEPQAENPKEAVLDSNPSTRWSAEGMKDVWIDLDLGAVKDVDTVFMSTYLGTQRCLVFKILVSEDGENYKEVYSGQTSGRSDDLEAFKIGAQKARHVRISCYGTSAGSWNSITELVVAKSN